MLKNRQASEQEEASQSRSSTWESSVRNISSTSKTSTMSYIDFKKPLDTVWHAALWAAMKKYNIRANLIRVINKETKVNGHMLETSFKYLG